MPTPPLPDATASRVVGPAAASRPPGPSPAVAVTGSATPAALPSSNGPAAVHITAKVPPPPQHHDHQAASLSGFGTLLEPVLRAACDGRLSEVTWFRADWQRGGALTGYATYAADDGRSHPVVVKLPVPPCERHWLARLQSFDHVTPHLYAHGDALGGYDLAWVVMERLPHGPLGESWCGREFDLIAEAVGRFYAASQHVPRTGDPTPINWPAQLDKARKRAAAGSLHDAPRWSAALKRAARKLKRWTAIWDHRNVDGWCHGDLHLGNAMTRTPAPAGPAMLFDFARTRVGHWLQDAVYLESQFWARPHRLEGRRLCRQIAHERKRLNLPVESDWPRLAEAHRTLLAMTIPATLHRDGDPRHVRAALQVLERAVG